MTPVLHFDGWPCLRCRMVEVPDAECLCEKCADILTEELRWLELPRDDEGSI